ncbi:MAG: ATP-binding cassette domain-containing protein [Bacteroidales bacterium]|nr:ATP-binding cassette domain-containing protein [Bacteroidales bacterium]
MNESMLNSLMRLFAIMVSINRDIVHILARNFVESYLTQQFSQKLADSYLTIFDEYIEELEQYEKGEKHKKISAWSVKILGICDQIVEELHIRHRFMILLSLIRFSRYFSDVSTSTSDFSDTISDAVRTVVDGLLITAEEYENCSAFITDKFYNVPKKESLLIVSDDRDYIEGEIRHVQKDNMSGQIFVLKIQRADTYLFQYVGKARLENNGKYIFPRHVYFLPRGGSIRGEGISPIYYSDIVTGYISYTDGHAVNFLAKDIEFHFKNSPNGIQQFSFQGKSGQLVGIIGGSGTGKSTLLKVLSGSLQLDRGDIYINGHHLVNNTDELEGMIGYIPQDDLLIEELTVYQNLYFNARLCLDGYTTIEINEAVMSVLKDLDLYEVRELKVGTPLNKFISGGQRKRLNIALELIREPHILFVDEPTSGLSSTDSENVVALLKEQALNGKLVLANIHQPSSELFKQFDHLLVLDRGGFPVYSGNPIEGITYFKQLAERVDAAESECITCGNTNPDDILQVIEARDVDKYGDYTSQRKTSPDEWYKHYREKIESEMKFSSEKIWVPYNKYMVPGVFRQFLIFFRRNLLSKLADRQFMSIALLVAPLLAVILGFFSKYVSGDDTDPHLYIFSQNANLPAYLFMSVVVALFLGLIIAAEEIIKDRKILERESFLNLNRTSYLLSKIALLFILSAIQMVLFVVIGNLIMEIKGLTISYWLVLFSTACFANLLGLIISDGLKSVVAIYVIVPFLLVPQILLAGVIVKFDKLHYTFASHQSVPVPGDLMTSRWAYEALAVNQFMNNRYQNDLYDLEMLESNITYDMQFLIPALIQEIEDASEIFRNGQDDHSLRKHLSTIRKGLLSIFLTGTYPGLEKINPDDFSVAIGEDAIRWLQKYQSGLSFHREKLSFEKDALVDSLKSASGGLEEYLQFKRTYHNDQLADLVLNRTELHKIVKKDGMLLRKMEPVYMYPVKGNGRAHFYTSVKRFGNFHISTLVFNILAIWVMSLVLYFLLRYSVLRKAVDFFGELNRRQ